MTSAPSDSPYRCAPADLVSLARDTAYDRYLQALLIKPISLRRDFLLLAAFHGELSRIPLLVNEPMMGELRLQWWHDTCAATEFISGGKGPDFGSPLANAVAGLIARHPSARAALIDAIDARRMELDPEAFSDTGMFDRYLAGAGTALFGLGLRVLGIVDTEDTRAAVDASGRAVASMELAQRLPHLAMRGRRYAIPHPDEDADSVDDAQSFADQGETARQVLRAHSMQALCAYRAVQPDLPSAVALAVLPLALVGPYFKSLPATPVRDTQTAGGLTPFGQLMRLWWAARHKRI